MSKFIHLVYTPFTGVGVVGYRGDEWFRQRIEIFKQYTLKSLLNQENRNFILWLSFRPQEIENPQVKELAQYLEGKIDFFFTFDGLMYWDDKFTKNIFGKLMNCARVVRRCLRNRTLEYFISSINEVLFQDKNSTLEQRLDKSLSFIRQYINGVDYVYLTRIDSDDMFHKSYIKEIHQRPLQGFLPFICNKGFIFNDTTQELAEYNPKSNPPFYTIIFPADIFFDANKHIGYYKDFKSHEDVPLVFGGFIMMNDYRYCVLTHNPKNQISTIFNHPFRGRIVENTYQVLKEFGQ